MQIYREILFRNTNWVRQHFSTQSMPISFNIILSATDRFLIVEQILKKTKLMNKRWRHINGRPNYFVQRNLPHFILKLNWPIDIINGIINEQEMAQKYLIEAPRKIPGGRNTKWAQNRRSIGCFDENLLETQRVFGWTFQAKNILQCKKYTTCT